MFSNSPLGVGNFSPHPLKTESYSIYIFAAIISSLPNDSIILNCLLVLVFFLFTGNN